MIFGDPDALIQLLANKPTSDEVKKQIEAITPGQWIVISSCVSTQLQMLKDDPRPGMGGYIAVVEEINGLLGPIAAAMRGGL